jgi:hypothetical protein
MNVLTRPPATEVAEYFKEFNDHTGFAEKAMKAQALRGMLDEVESVLRQHIVMGEHELAATVLWIAHTYQFQHFSLSPRLFVVSEGPGAGKSELLRQVAKLSFRGVHVTTKVTDSVLARMVETFGPRTTAFDQLDNAFDLKVSGIPQMVDRLISGADRGSKALINVQHGKDWEPTEFDLFFPTAMAMIGDTLPSAALQTRCIVIRMFPTTTEQDKALQRARKDAGREIAVKKGLPTLIAAREAEYPTWKPIFPPGFINRARDKWRPLLAMAEAAGMKWARRGQLAAMALQDWDDEPEALPSHIVLAKVVEVTRGWQQPFIASAKLDQLLHETSKRRSGFLKRVGLRPERFRLDGGEQHRGYRIEAIRQAAERHLRHM